MPLHDCRPLMPCSRAADPSSDGEGGGGVKVALHQSEFWRCTVKFIRSECDKGCDWCIYVTVVTCADSLTSTLCRKEGRKCFI